MVNTPEHFNTCTDNVQNTKDAFPVLHSISLAEKKKKIRVLIFTVTKRDMTKPVGRSGYYLQAYIMLKNLVIQCCDGNKTLNA